MNFICKRNLEYLKEFRKRQRLPAALINDKYRVWLGPLKSEISGNFSCFSSVVLDEGKGSDMSVPNLFSLTPKLQNFKCIVLCGKHFSEPGSLLAASLQGVSQLSWEELLCGIRARWGGSTVFGSPFWVIDQTLFLGWLWVSDTWKHLDVTFLELD